MYKPIKYKASIRKKVISSFYLVTFLVVIIAFSLGYIWGVRLIKNSIGADYVKMTQLIATSIDQVFDTEINKLETYASSPVWREAVSEGNLKYRATPEQNIEEYLKDLDKRWGFAKEDDPLVKSYLNNLMGIRLRKLEQADRSIREIFLTDKFGGLIASSGKTTDFYQADERWWQQAFSAGKGKIFIGDVAFDESASAMVITFALPIKDEDNQIIGICKAIIDVNRFFKIMEGFQIGKTGEVALINEKNRVIFHYGSAPLSEGIFSEEDFKRILTNDKQWAILSGLKFHKGKQFVAYSKVKYPPFLEENIGWFILLRQNENEIFTPLYQFNLVLLGIFLISASLLIPLGLFFAKVFTGPIKELHKGTEHIGKGDLDYRIKITTGDEIEQLADAFNQMAEGLKNTTTSIDNLNKEITERKRTESALSEEKKRLSVTLEKMQRLAAIVESSEEIIKKAYLTNRAILEKAPFGVYLVNENGGVDYFNPAMLRISGDNPEQFKKINTFELPSYKEKGIDKKIKAVFEGESFFMGSVDYVSHISGKRTIRNITGIPFMEEGKKKALIFIEDITQQKKIEDEIRHAYEEWVRTFDSIADMIFIESPDSTILKANKAFITAMGKKPEEIIGKKCYSVVHKQNKPWPNCPFEKTKLDSTTHVEEVFDEKLGVSLLIATSQIFDDQKKLIGAVHVAKDISEIKKAREDLEEKNAELRKLDQLKSEFVSMVSHELRTPLSITKEGISLILDGIPGSINEKQQKILETSKDNIDRLARIINELLDISKIEAGKIEVRRESVRINNLINSIISLFQFKAGEKGLELKVVLPEKDIDIYVDADKITEVLTNLLDNAIKFTEKGTVTISVVENEKEIACSIEDTGIGISKEDLSKTFDKFQQFSRAVGPGGKGTGLGLSIAKGIVQLHKGRIWVESELGKGAKFTFSLPKETYSSLTKEYINLGIKDSSENKSSFALMMVLIDNFEDLKRQLSTDKLRAILNGMESTIRNNLRKTGDTALKDSGEFTVFLLDCNKEYALKVEARLKEALGSYLAIQGVAEKIKLGFSNAIYPDEAKTYEQILEKVKEKIVKKEDGVPNEKKNTSS